MLRERVCARWAVRSAVMSRTTLCKLLSAEREIPEPKRKKGKIDRSFPITHFIYQTCVQVRAIAFVLRRQIVSRTSLIRALRCVCRIYREKLWEIKMITLSAVYTRYGARGRPIKLDMLCHFLPPGERGGGRNLKWVKNRSLFPITHLIYRSRLFRALRGIYPFAIRSAYAMSRQMDAKDRL